MRFNKNMTFREKGSLIEKMNEAEKPIRKTIELKNSYHRQVEIDLKKRISRTNDPETSMLLFKDKEAMLMHEKLPSYFHN